MPSSIVIASRQVDAQWAEEGDPQAFWKRQKEEIYAAYQLYKVTRHTEQALSQLEDQRITIEGKQADQTLAIFGMRSQPTAVQLRETRQFERSLVETRTFLDQTQRDIDQSNIRFFQRCYQHADKHELRVR